MPPFDAVKLALVPPLANDKGKEGIWDVVARVPEVGKVTDVVLVMVKVEAKAPEVVKLPPRVMVLDPLFTPVPP